MTISNPTNLATLTGNGATTSFPYTFLIPDEDSVEVTLLTIDSGAETDPLDQSLYTISGIGDPAGGEVEYPLVGSPLAATHKINIRRVVPFEQGLSLTSQSGYDPEALEDQLDLIVMQIQQIAEEVGRAILTTAGSGIDPNELIANLFEAETNAAASAADSAGSALDAAATLAAAEALLAGIGSIDDLNDVDTDTDPPDVGDGLTWDGTNWVPGAAGGGMFRGNNGTVGSRSGDIFRINAQTLTEDVTIGATENASAAGPIAVETGNTLTVASGGTLAIV